MARVGRLRLVEEHVHQPRNGALENVQRSAHHHRSEGPAQDDERGGDLRDVLDLAALHQQTTQDAAKGQQDPAESGEVRTRPQRLGFARSAWFGCRWRPAWLVRPSR